MSKENAELAVIVTPSLMRMTGFDAPTIDLSPEAEERKQQVLAITSQVLVVKDAATQDVATAALKRIKEVSDAFDESRKEIKKPVDDLAKRIQEVAKKFQGELDLESQRIKKLIEPFQMAERARVAREQEEARKEAQRIADEAARVKAEAARKFATATTPEEVAQFRAVLAAPPAPVARPSQITATKSKGLAGTKDWDITVHDVMKLMQVDPAFVTITVNEVEIKKALRENFQFPEGVLTAKEKLNISLR